MAQQQTTKKSIKILACGPVNGKIEQLFNRVIAVNKQAGPFDALFCVGDFFGNDYSDLKKYKDNSAQVPLPTYVLDQKPSEYALASSTICPNLHVLDNSGVRVIADLRVAFGLHTDDGTVENILSLAGSGIDLLLTGAWPTGIDKLAAKAPEHSEMNSEIVSRLASILCPRYHIVPTSGNYYERAPYRNPKSVNISRFMALSPAFNADKQKYLVALNLSGNSAEPANTTDSPYAVVQQAQQAVKKQKIEPPPQMMEPPKQFNRWGLEEEELPHKSSSAAGQQPSHRRRGGGKNNSNFKPNPQECWFCPLTSPHVETHLITSIGDDVYMALPKGGIVEDHVLLIPIEHHPALAVLPESTQAEIAKYKEALQKYFAKSNKTMVVFERNLPTKGTLHGHLQVVGIPNNLIEKALPLLLNESSVQGFQFSEFPTDKNIYDIVGPSSYFSIEIYGKRKTLHVYMPSETSNPVPLQFGREWVAKLLGCLDRVDWKQCALDKKQETKLVEKFKSGFSEFDPAS